MRKKSAAAIPQTEEEVSVASLITNITTVARIVAKIQGDLTALQQFAACPPRKVTESFAGGAQLDASSPVHELLASLAKVEQGKEDNGPTSIWTTDQTTEETWQADIWSRRASEKRGAVWRESKAVVESIGGGLPSKKKKNDGAQAAVGLEAL
jgi:hypothetical protein